MTEKQSEEKKAAPDDDEDEDVKKWRVVTGSSLIGCPGKRVQPGDTVTEVKPPEDGYVLVATEDGREGSLPVSCVGEQWVITIIITYTYIPLIIFRGAAQGGVARGEDSEADWQQD